MCNRLTEFNFRLNSYRSLSHWCIWKSLNICPSPSYELKTGETQPSGLCWYPVLENDSSEFKTVENSTGNDSTIFPIQSWQFVAIKEKMNLWRVIVTYVLKGHGIKNMIFSNFEYFRGYKISWWKKKNTDWKKIFRKN